MTSKFGNHAKTFNLCTVFILELQSFLGGKKHETSLFDNNTFVFFSYISFPPTLQVKAHVALQYQFLGRALRS